MVIEHYIAGVSIPHSEGAIPLTKESFEVTNPQKRVSDFSKTITLPESKLLNQVLEHAFDVNVSFQSFNPNKKTSYKVVQDGITVLNGYCQLKSINEVNGKVVYNIVATGQIGDLFEKIKDLKLSDIDFSSFNHVWNKANIVSSWTPTLGEGYVYPMINLGGRTQFDVWKVTDLKPSIFLHEYITRIFSEQGYTIDSTFFDSTLFKSLIIPFTDEDIPLSNAKILDLSYAAVRSGGDVLINSLNSFNFTPFIFDNEIYNTLLNEYNPITGQYSPLASQRVVMTGTLDLNIDYFSGGIFETNTLNFYLSQPSASVKFEYVVQDNLGRQFRGFVDVTNVFRNFTFTPNTQYFFDTFGSFSIEYEVDAGLDYFFAVNSRLFVTAAVTGSRTVTMITGLTIKTASEVKVTSQRKTITEGEVVDLSSTANSNVTQSELLSSVIKRFNLHLEYDKVDENKIYIEPKDDFYTSDVIDLTQKVDRLRDYEIEPVGLLDANEYLFADKEGDDVVNKNYKAATNEVYGQSKYEVDNDFVKKTKKIENIFTPTPLEVDSTTNDRVISSVRLEDENGNRVKGANKIRLIYWGGLLNTTAQWSLEEANGTRNIYSTYPYAGHLDNPYNPTFDLNWGVTKRIYYDFRYTGSDTVIYPNSNCFNVFWRKDIKELTDPNSKVLKCYVAIRPTLYDAMSFRKRYYIDGSYWRLIKVEDYDLTSNQTTLCVFIKVEPSVNFSYTTREVFGGGESYSDTGEQVPLFDNIIRPNDGTGGRLDSLIYGDNVQAARRSLIVSNGLISASGIRNVTALNSDGALMYGDSSVAINSPNKIINNGDVYINSLFIEKVLDVTFNEDELDQLNTFIDLLPPLPDNKFYELTRGYARYQGTISPGTANLIFTIDNVIMASIPNTFFNMPNSIDAIQIEPQQIFFGKSVRARFFNNEEFSSGAVLRINLMYRILEI